MSAIVGASAALSGLILVFLGAIVAEYGGLAGDAPRSVKERLRQAGRIVFVPFVIGLLSMLGAISWLVRGGDDEALYVAVVFMFFVQLLGMGVAASYTLRKLLWD